MAIKEIGEAIWKYTPLRGCYGVEIFEVNVLTGEEFNMKFYELQLNSEPLERNSHLGLITTSYDNVVSKQVTSFI